MLLSLAFVAVSVSASAFGTFPRQAGFQSRRETTPPQIPRPCADGLADVPAPGTESAFCPVATGAPTCCNSDTDTASEFNPMELSSAATPMLCGLHNLALIASFPHCIIDSVSQPCICFPDAVTGSTFCWASLVSQPSCYVDLVNLFTGDDNSTQPYETLFECSNLVSDVFQTCALVPDPDGAGSGAPGDDVFQRLSACPDPMPAAATACSQLLQDVIMSYYCTFVCNPSWVLPGSPNHAVCSDDLCPSNLFDTCFAAVAPALCPAQVGSTASCFLEDDSIGAPGKPCFDVPNNTPVNLDSCPEGSRPVYGWTVESVCGGTDNSKFVGCVELSATCMGIQDSLWLADSGDIEQAYVSSSSCGPAGYTKSAASPEEICNTYLDAACPALACGDDSCMWKTYCAGFTCGADVVCNKTYECSATPSSVFEFDDASSLASVQHISTNGLNWFWSTIDGEGALTTNNTAAPGDQAFLLAAIFSTTDVVQIAFESQFDTEYLFDWATLIMSLDNGVTWSQVDASVFTENGYTQAEGFGGVRGRTRSVAQVPVPARSSVRFGFLYHTDWVTFKTGFTLFNFVVFSCIVPVPQVTIVSGQPIQEVRDVGGVTVEISSSALQFTGDVALAFSPPSAPPPPSTGAPAVFFDLSFEGTGSKPENFSLSLTFHVMDFDASFPYDLLIFVDYNDGLGQRWGPAGNTCDPPRASTFLWTGPGAAEGDVTATVCHLTPLALVPVPIPTQTRVFGDPHFRGLAGQRFLLSGEAGKVYNLLTTPDLAVNALFGAAAGPGQVTVLYELGIVVGDDAIYADKKAHLKVNGQMAAAETVLSDGVSTLTRDVNKTGKGIVLRTPEFVLRWTPRGFEIDLSEVRMVRAGDAAVHGLIGQTWKTAGWPLNAFTTEITEEATLFGGPLAGRGMGDYELRDGLLGHAFAFSTFDSAKHATVHTVPSVSASVRVKRH